ncbi:hypothetical protein C4D60_Mb11t23230 [Musa balbisiana]|uniref:Major facilitator superfamily (MFS) profile domain-containing protein n=1 Tax=Musa balbisiana TaxID=52838 RepID=A0A4S8J764_MUSBA|nr:hypothetical protein C4D60_Mb11t23230 [Musa balbisiana]
MAPADFRGTLNIGFQFMITIGIFAANIINYGTASIKGGWGWRVSLGLAAIPALIITIGSLVLPDTPNSLIERGHDEEAKAMLRKIRGTEDIRDEYDDLVAASDEAKSVDNPWSNILQRKYRPQLTIAILIPFFQQLTGINVIMFYAPVLFKTIGFGSEASLASAVISGIVNVFATFVSITTVDKLGRRALFLQGGTQMLLSQLVVGTLIAFKFGISGVATDVTKNYASIIVLFICFYVAAFAWSWGPLGWLVPSEIFPLEIRSAGQSITVSVNMLFTFLIAQVFLTALCHLKFGLFYFFAGWVAIMTAFIAFFLPETKSESGRRAGLSKKVKELSLLCGAELALIVFSPACNPFSFDHPSVHSVIGCFLSSRAVSLPSIHCRHLLLPTVRRSLHTLQWLNKRA